jgi:hypothetical protein
LFYKYILTCFQIAGTPTAVRLKNLNTRNPYLNTRNPYPKYEKSVPKYEKSVPKYEKSVPKYEKAFTHSYLGIIIIKGGVTMDEKVDGKNMVVKSNYFIMNSSYDLSLEEQKLILSLASLVHPDDENFKPYLMRISDLMDIFRVESKTKYSEIPKITKGLMKKVFEIFVPAENKMIQVAWLSSAEYVKGSGAVELEFSPKLKPYMLQLKEKFTQYQLANVLCMKSKYAPRLYEILKSNEFKRQGYEIIAVAELRRLLKAENKYPRYNDFKRFIIDQAIKEINQLTDLNVEYEAIKTGRAVTSLKFYIKSQRPEQIEHKQKAILPPTQPQPNNQYPMLSEINNKLKAVGLNPIMRNSKTEPVIQRLIRLDTEQVKQLVANLVALQRNTGINNATAYMIKNNNQLDSFITGDIFKIIPQETKKKTEDEYEIYVPSR